MTAPFVGLGKCVVKAINAARGALHARRAMIGGLCQDAAITGRIETRNISNSNLYGELIRSRIFVIHFDAAAQKRLTYKETAAVINRAEAGMRENKVYKLGQLEATKQGTAMFVSRPHFLTEEIGY